MIPTLAMRRVAFAGASKASTPPMAIWTMQQRRMSSSKPSSPDGSKSVSEMHTSTSSRSASGKAGGEKRKRRAKDALDRDDSFRHLPCVPSTHHMTQEAIGLSTFFSLHRPISVTHSLPKTVSDEAFAAIFSPKTRAAKVSEVISTLASTVDDIEGPMAEMKISPSPDGRSPAHVESASASDGSTKIDIKYSDDHESSIYMQLNSMTGNFLPFQPPPLPTPQSATDMADRVASAEATAETTDQPQHRVYRALFTIEQTTEADGKIRVVAHSPEILDDGVPATGFRSRRMRIEDALKRRSTMQAISVKRQRKLKMKKKKYKKFMKRTRNLRRKLDRL
ncbi:hypothetical protein TD95_001179 [Thielaviopsis punctulata]|uniref:Small ribosomal subunit protein mS38 n=1 Tax=Thielaviopsis punctulata TaxID=72032 RepID=A0A0F4ZK07_9PEZI|nr:hypothetical protein TD95_001179 [Thielaviopsis punctulata]